MTTLFLLLGFLVAVGAGLGLTLRHLFRVRPEGILANPAGDLLTGSALETYQPMSRLFAEEDFTFVSGLDPGLRKRLRRSRRQVMRSYLRELRVDFADRKSTRLNSSHIQKSRMPSSA